MADLFSSADAQRVGSGSLCHRLRRGFGAQLVPAASVGPGQSGQLDQASMQSHRFSKDRRVRRRSEFQHAFSTGTRVHGKFLTLLMAPNRAGTTRLGLVASRKLGNSAQRNRAKRLLREIFRQTVSSADRAGADIIVIPRRELLDASYSTLEQDFRSALRRCASRLSGHAR